MDKDWTGDAEEMNELMRKLLMLSAKCTKCGYEVRTSDDEISHCIKHALEELKCSDRTRRLVQLIDHEFSLNNLEEAEEVINHIFAIMDENIKVKFKINNYFEIVKNAGEEHGE